MRYDADRQRSVIRFRITQPRTASLPCPAGLRTVPLRGSDGTALAAGAERLGFVEGVSVGHLSARGVTDGDGAFNGWPRQSFDHDALSDKDGGRVWEHWSTTSDIRSSSAIGTSVLEAYLTLVSCLGGRFVAAVCAWTAETQPSETARRLPDPISRAPQNLLYEARPADALAASELLPFTTGAQRYFLFQRRIRRRSKVASVKRDLGI